VLRVLPRAVRGGALRADADRERRVGPPQPRSGQRVQHVQRHPLPQRHDLFRPLAPEPRPPSVPRQPRTARRPGARPQGDDPLHRRPGSLRGARRAGAALPEGAVNEPRQDGAEPHRLVAIGASWGGLNAVRSLLARLPGDLAAAIVVAQHRSAESHRTALRDLFAAVTPLEVCEPGDKDELRAGVAYLAAPDYHLLIEGDHLELSVDEPVAFARPSIDVLLESAADAY